MLKMSEKELLLGLWLKLQEQMNVMEEKMVGLLWEFGSALQTHQQQLEDLWKDKPDLLTIDYEIKENESEADVLERFGNDLTEWIRKVEKILEIEKW